MPLNATQSFQYRKALLKRFEGIASKCPDHIAVVAGGVTLTYGKLWEESSILAAELVQFGEPDSIVAVDADRSIVPVIAVLACWQSQRAYLGIDKADPRGSIALALKRLSPVAVVSQAGTIGNVPRGNSNLIASPPDTLMAYVVPTSGTTGSPKFCAVDFRALGTVCEGWTLRLADAHFARGHLVVAPTYVDMFILEVARAVSNGGTLIIAAEDERADVAALSRLIEQWKVAFCDLTPALLTELVSLAETDGNCFKSLSTIICGSDSWTTGLLRRASNVFGDDVVTNVYGTSESLPDAMIGTRSNSVAIDDDPAPLEYSFTGISVSLRNSSMESLSAAQDGIGEIYIGGNISSRGYCKDPARTADKFLPDPDGFGSRLFRTGDKGKWQHRSLYVLGRTAPMLSVRGRRIDRAEVIRNIESLFANATVVLTKEKRVGDDLLIADISSATPIGAVELRTSLLARLPSWMIPDEFRGTGIVQQPLTMTLQVASSTAEATLSVLFRETLGLEGDVDGHLNFMVAGGTSLRAGRVIAKIRARLGWPLSMRAFLHHPTIALLLEHAISQGWPLEPKKTAQ